METVVLVIHLIVALAIIVLVLLQRSEGGGLGMGGGGGGMGSFASARGTANALTRLTAICAAIFFMTSLSLGVLASRGQVVEKGILENVVAEDVPAQAPVEGVAPSISYKPPVNTLPEINIEVVPDDEAVPEVAPDAAVETEATQATPSEPVEEDAPSEAVDSDVQATPEDNSTENPTPPAAE